MNGPRIIVVDTKGRDALMYPTPGYFYLVQDRWDDFGFKTQYTLTYVGADQKIISIGSVKILMRGQLPSNSSILDASFQELPEDFCSLGQTLDYYQRLADMPEDDRDYILGALKDVIRDRSRVANFEFEQGWRTSVLRYIDPVAEYFSMASILLEQNYSALPTIEASFHFHLPDWQRGLEFNFDAPAVDDPRPWLERVQEGSAQLPRRVSVVIGRNGAGKSTLLSRLARVAHASRRDRARKRLSRFGTLSPDGLGFTRVITVSYSAFDNFQVPGMTSRERRTIAQEISLGTGRFIFCGLRDIAAELEAELGSDTSTESEKSSLDDRQQVTILKSSNTLASEFARIVARIRDNQRMGLLRDVLVPVLQDPSFNDMRDSVFDTLLGGECESAFLGWSTGHKIVMHLVCSLVAYVEKQSLVLFDEPETHLHPPMLAALMHSLRLVLERQVAYAIVATHSPVVLQETLAAHVYVVAREGALTTVQRPSGETFGENIGLLTSNVFNLTSQVTDFNETLGKLARQLNDLNSIEALFGPGGLSVQARAYVMSILTAKG